MLGACRNPGLSQPPPPAIKSAAKENIASHQTDTNPERVYHGDP
jgi:hypothetical protein